jgi:hypothetical protein
VKHRHGWCATADNREPAEGTDWVPTLCGIDGGTGIVAPGGYDKREPDCADCLALLPTSNDVLGAEQISRLRLRHSWLDGYGRWQTYDGAKGETVLSESGDPILLALVEDDDILIASVVGTHNELTSLLDSHEVLRAELDLYRSLAERYADMWQPQFSLNPDEGLWVFPWAEDVADEAMTPEQVAWLRKRREARR